MDRSQLVNLKTHIPSIHIKCVYATPDNFVGKIIYPKVNCSLLKEVANALANVQADLQKQNLGLSVYDAFRPMYAQKKLWET